MKAPSWFDGHGFVFVVGGLVTCLLGYAFGRYAAPTKVVTTETVVTREDTKAKAQVVELTKQLETMKRHTVKQTTRKPDGTVTIVEDTHVDNTRDTRTDVDIKTEVATVKTVEVVKTVEITRPAPQWRLTPMVGVDLRSRALVYGGGVERRILGPAAFGIWGLSTGAAGVSLSLEF